LSRLFLILWSDGLVGCRGRCFRSHFS
jgi:hypothetical protein